MANKLSAVVVQRWKDLAEARRKFAEACFEEAFFVDDMSEKAQALQEEINEMYVEFDDLPMWESSRPPDRWGCARLFDGIRTIGRRSHHGAQKPRHKNVRRGHVRA